MPSKIDLTGMKFGKLTIIREDEPHLHPSGKTGVKWECVCECGKKVYVFSQSLRRGVTVSCGCSKEKHLKTGSAEFNIWVCMKQRCYNTEQISYPNYGGRGIQVCDRWLESFENFLEDMGERPSTDYSIERRDYNGDYHPANCEWVKKEYQARNHRKQSNNTSGVTGVYVEPTRIRAMWTDLYGTLKSKSYSINKYGYEEAFSLACKYRDKMIKILNEKGAKYSEKHGK